jgi:cytochrome P450
MTQIKHWSTGRRRQPFHGETAGNANITTATRQYPWAPYGYLFEADAQGPWFERLRDEDPVHYCHERPLGSYWSVTRYEDIMTMNTSHDIFSSEPTITIRDDDEYFKLPMFIAMDQLKHDEQREVVNPAVGTTSLETFEPLIRERTADVLDALPIGETLEW